MGLPTFLEKQQLLATNNFTVLHSIFDVRVVEYVSFVVVLCFNPSLH